MSTYDDLYADMIGGWRVATGPGAEEDDTRPELPEDEEDDPIVALCLTDERVASTREDAAADDLGDVEEDHVMGIEESAAIASAVRASGGSASDAWEALQAARRTLRAAARRARMLAWERGRP